MDNINVIYTYSSDGVIYPDTITNSENEFKTLFYNKTTNGEYNQLYLGLVPYDPETMGYFGASRTY